MTEIALRTKACLCQALRTNRTIGTLVWLFNVHKTGVISRPLDQLLHYPAPREPPEGFSSHVRAILFYEAQANDMFSSDIENHYIKLFRRSTRLHQEVNLSYGCRIHSHDDSRKHSCHRSTVRYFLYV